MNILFSLAWKEWREVRIYLWIAIGIFIGLPLVAAIEQQYFFRRHHFEITTSPWVLALGGVLAIFVAVGATCRDFTGRLEDFWRSRPVSIVQWLAAKYFVGLAVVIFACVLPLAVEFAIDRDLHVISLVSRFPFLCAALYSIGFLAGCLVRRTAHAAMVALAGMLLLYLLPIVLPPLQRFNVMSGIMELGEFPWTFAIAMIALAAVDLLFALLAVHRDWRIASGRKLIYGSIASALLILFSSAAYQLGTNMPILRQIDMPGGEPILSIQYAADRGYLVIPNSGSNLNVREFELTANGFELGSVKKLATNFINEYQVHPPGDPETVFYLRETESNPESVLSLYVARIGEESGTHILDVAQGSPQTVDWSLLYATKDRLYVIGTRLIILDISQPRAPRVISDTHLAYFWGAAINIPFTINKTMTVALPPIPGLSPKERLQAILARPSVTFEADTFCIVSHDGNLLAYHLKHLTDTEAIFEKIGEYQPTILDGIFTVTSAFNMKLQNGLLYVWEGNQNRNTWANPRISVFDTRGPHPIQLIGHFAAPGVRNVCPLPDGTALVGGDKLWLIGPPPHHD